ncbi:class I SAM-dependent methyltransferase [Erythrobacter sp. YT30]|uniref:methyltransferase domain-containing protein n=1 Tax=Erythrobacter sp. YT30 TaxID=1735012 RepID=UPI00076DBCDF|nr:class I SAM-dependent methyltransferase [Erythrobacter sp. YT30]KWV90511.1 hypothetical protein AUC45_14850 [Erythrobacter sp. YT30]
MIDPEIVFAKTDWKPTKYEPTGLGWRVSGDVKQLSPASVISASLALRSTLSALENHAAGDLADFGCGNAPFYGAYKEHSRSVFWVDWPSSPHQTKHLDLVADLNEPVAIDDASFDTVFASSVLEHIWKHDVFLDEIDRVLRPEGKLILIVPFMYWLHEEPHDFFRWTRHALERACNERGLEVVELAPYGGGPDLMIDLTVRTFASINLSFAKFVARPLARLVTSAWFQRFGQTSREKLPLGYTLVAKKRKNGVLS